MTTPMTPQHDQDRLIKWISNDDNLKKAVEGSMDKRLKVLAQHDRDELRQEILKIALVKNKVMEQVGPLKQSTRFLIQAIVELPLDDLMQLIDTHVAAIERSAFKRGQRVGQYQAADKIYGHVTTIWVFRDSDDAKALKMNVERIDDMLKDCERFLNHNAKVYREYVAQLRTTQEADNGN